MCGLTVLLNPSASKLSTKERYTISQHKANKDMEDAFSLAMFVSTSRGEDSAGVMTFSKLKWSSKTLHRHTDPVLDWYKKVGAWKSATTFNSYALCTAINESPIVAGHVRKATTGSKDCVDGAHPHSYGNITLMHNGTLDSWRSVALKEFPDDKIETDSILITKLIGKYGAKVAIEMVSGAKTLLWFDTALNTFNIFKSSGRTLGWVKLSNGATLISSEMWMAFMGADKNGFDVVEHGFFKDGTHTVYNIDTTEIISVNEYVEKEPEPVVYEYAYGNYNRSHYSRSSGVDLGKKSESNIPALPPPFATTNTANSNADSSQLLTVSKVRRGDLVVFKPYFIRDTRSSNGKFAQLVSMYEPESSLGVDSATTPCVDVYTFGLRVELANLLMSSKINWASAATGTSIVPEAKHVDYAKAFATNPGVLLPVLDWTRLAMSNEHEIDATLKMVEAVYKEVITDRSWASAIELSGALTGNRVKDYYDSVVYYLECMAVGDESAFIINETAKEMYPAPIDNLCPLIYM